MRRSSWLRTSMWKNTNGSPTAWNAKSSLTCRVSPRRITAKGLHAVCKLCSAPFQIGDGNLELARILRTKKERNLWFNQELRDKLGSLFDLVEQALYVMVTNLENPTAEGVERSRAIEQQINLTSARLRGEQLQEAQGQDYKYMAGIAFIELVVECEKLGDAAVHISAEQAEGL